MSIAVSKFGEIDNQEVFLFSIKNENGMIANVINYGAILQSLYVLDKNSHLQDVVLGYDHLEEYLENPCYFGATIGRNSNRIKNASFSINNTIYTLDQNEKNNNLHSGFSGYDKRIWDYEIMEDKNKVCFCLFSPDMDQGFPGNFKVFVSYTLTDKNELIIEYNGSSDKDTIVNMTNHTYFNLGGQNLDAMDQILFLNSDSFVPVDENMIPIGTLEKVQNTPMDFTSPKKIGQEINQTFKQFDYTGGYDHCYMLHKKTSGIEKFASLYHETTKIKMNGYTDCFGVQLYSGNFINEFPIGKNNTVYKKRSGICLETGFLPDAIHQDQFVSPILKAGKQYHTTTTYQFE